MTGLSSKTDYVNYLCKYLYIISANGTREVKACPLCEQPFNSTEILRKQKGI